MSSAIAGRAIWVLAKGYAPDEGGMQTYARAVAEAYAAKGADVTVFTQTSVGPRDCMIGPVRVIDIGPGKSVQVPLCLLRALQRERRAAGAPWLLHATTWRTSVLPMLLRLPYVTSFHGREFMYPKGLALAVMRRVARGAAQVVAVSRFSGDALAARVPGLRAPPLVVWNGVTDGLERGDGNGTDKPLILSLCRLEPRKNILSAIRAVALCHAEGRAFRYVICGRGPDYEAALALVAQLRLEQVIEVAGFVDQARAVTLYRNADIFLHPQIIVDGGRDFEGFGIAIADAMYARTAVIVGKDGGSAELVEDGVSGLVVDGQDVAAIAGAVRSLLDNPERRRVMQSAAAAHAETAMRWDRHVDAILAYSGVL